MSNLPLGIANSVSANFQYDPLDTIQFAGYGNFEMIQISLNEKLLQQNRVLQKIKRLSKDFKQIYYRAEGLLNDDFGESPYRQYLYNFLKNVKTPNYIINFDEQFNINRVIELVEALSEEAPRIYVENYFRVSGKVAAEKNLKKYMALFALSENFGYKLYPVLDIPVIFNQKLGFTAKEALEWCYQILNFFGNRNTPVLLHLIDAVTSHQRHYCAVGKGHIPYSQIFQFILKTRPNITGIVLEFEDKINPLQSRDYIQEMLPLSRH